jgi:hypothetical protein
MDSGKYKKLLDYAISLEKLGNQFEKDQVETEAIPNYIKMVDVLLLLAEVAPDYSSWQRFTDRADFYQKRVKILIAKASAKMNTSQESAQDAHSSEKPIEVQASSTKM